MDARDCEAHTTPTSLSWKPKGQNRQNCKFHPGSSSINRQHQPPHAARKENPRRQNRERNCFVGEIKRKLCRFPHPKLILRPCCNSDSRQDRCSENDGSNQGALVIHATRSLGRCRRCLQHLCCPRRICCRKGWLGWGAVDVSRITSCIVDSLRHLLQC